jgi:hypothetical protein
MSLEPEFILTSAFLSRKGSSNANSILAKHC